MMCLLHRLNHSFVHGVAAYAAYASGPIVHNNMGLILACLICVYAGWCRQAYLAAFLGGVITAVVGPIVMTVVGSPDVGAGVFFMVPFALALVLPVALAGYAIGRVAFTMAGRWGRHTETGR
jgi:hypothetical protein